MMGQFKGVMNKPSGMTNFFVFIFLGSLVGLVVGLIKPGLMLPMRPSREMVSCVYGGVAIASFVLIAITAPQLPQAEQPPQKQETIAVSPTPSRVATPPLKPSSSPAMPAASSPGISQGEPIEKLLAVDDGREGQQAEYAQLLDALEPICIEDRNGIGQIVLDASGAATAQGIPTKNVEALQGLIKATEGQTNTECQVFMNAMLKLMGVN